MYYVIARHLGLTVEVSISDHNQEGIPDPDCERRVVTGPISTMEQALCVQADVLAIEQERLQNALASLTPLSIDPVTQSFMEVTDLCRRAIIESTMLGDEGQHQTPRGLSPLRNMYTTWRLMEDLKKYFR